MKNLLCVLIVLTVTTISLPQTENPRFIHPLSDKFGISFEGGATYSKTDFPNTDIDYQLRTNFEYFIESSSSWSIGLRALGGYGFLAGNGLPAVNLPNVESFRTKIIYAGFGPTLNYAISKHVVPFVSLGFSYLYIEPLLKDNTGAEFSYNNNVSPNQFMVIGEGGFRFLLSKHVSINFSGGINFVNNDNLDNVPNSISNGTDNDIFFSGLAGISFYLGGVKDSDNDGIKDKNDMCPDTPEGVLVDDFGCPADNDRDGVPDYMDACPNTPVNIPVNDSGCPLDSDGDGVADYLDLCNDTPEKVPVDNRGCPFDSDGDEVPDYRDLCPNTKTGTEVDKWGCEIKEEITKILPETRFVLAGGLNFETGKSNLLPNAITELNKIVAVMLEYSDSKWRIEGHTDDRGSKTMNTQLSLDRASSVYNYLVSKGVKNNRMEIKGFGPDNPIGDNSSETGRALNRRVTIVRVDAIGNTSAGQVMFDTDKYNYNARVEKNVGGMIFTDGQVYTVQASSWRFKEKADKEVSRLNGMGLNAFVIETTLPGLDGIWFRVRVGYFNSLSEAQRIKEIISR